MEDLPSAFMDRIAHYFRICKLVGAENQVAVGNIEGAHGARAIVTASMADYDERFGGD